MKKLLLCALGALSLLTVSSAQAIIWARQVWEHKDDAEKTVEILFDAHAEELLGEATVKESDDVGVSQKDLFLSNRIDLIAQQQQKDIVWYAALYGNNVHVLVEDMYSSSLKKISNGKLGRQILFWRNKKLFLYFKMSVLSGLNILCQQAKVPCTNLEFRADLVKDYVRIEKEVAQYDDGTFLNALYKDLDTMSKDWDNMKRANHNLFNVRLIHHVANCSAQHQIVVVGSMHCACLSMVLPEMGYTLREKSVQVHSDIQKSLDKEAESASELIVQKGVSFFLSANPLSASAFRALSKEDNYWAMIFRMTHPINIRAIVEQERKEVAAKRAGSASSSSSMPAPVLRARL